MSESTNICEHVRYIVNEVLKCLNLQLMELENEFSELNIDSVTFIHIIVSLEENFGIEVPDEYLIFSELNTIQKMADLISDVLI